MSVVGAPRSQGLIARVTNILVRPRVEWDVIAGEPATVQGLFLGYAAILAAIPAAAQLVHGLTPHCSFFVLCSTPNPAWAVVSAVLDYVVWLALVLLTGIVIDALAQSFGGERSRIQAMKVAVYSCTAAWLAGALIVVPILGPLLALAGLYSLYLLYAGLGPLMKVPPDKTPIYAIVVVVVAIVIYAVASAITAQVAMMSALAGGGVTAAPGQLSGTVRLGDGASVDLGRLQAGIKQGERELRRSQEAARTGKINAIDPNVLKGLLPDNVGGAPRTEITAASAGAAGMGGSDAEATYQNGDQHITLRVADIAAAGGFAAMASAISVNADHETATGYEKVQTINGRLTTEKYDNQDKSGRYSVIIGGRFIISADGSGVPIETLKAAVAAVGPDRLEALARG